MVNIDKASNRKVSVNNFYVVSHRKKKCVVNWVRTYSPMCGTATKVTITFVKGKWIITDIELESIS